MFYTKYRPQIFSQISKPNDVAEALANQIKSGKTGHAYLFVGPRGTGKTTAARILAKALNCENISKSGDPCDECKVCSSIKLGSFMDLIEIDAASNRGIDDIRELKDKIKLAPSSGGKKIYIVDEVHMLTTEAFNALLKTLEEPPAHAVFVLCTTEDHKIPETIKSRCQIFKFKRATTNQIVEKLKHICKKENVKMKDEDLLKIANASAGGFRDAENLLQQIIEGELDVDSFVGVSSKQNYIDFVKSINSSDTPSAIRQINKLYDDGVDLHSWSQELLKYLRDLLFISADAHEGLIDETDEIFDEMQNQANNLNVKKIALMLNEFVEATNNIKDSSIAQLPLEVAVVKIISTNPDTDPKVQSTTEPANNNPTQGGDDDMKKTGQKQSKTSSFLNTSIDDIANAWEDVLSGVLGHNHGVKALLKATRPASINGNLLVLEVYYKFHKERLESPRNKSIVELVLSDIFGESIGVSCVLSDKKPERVKHKPEELTDYNVSVPTDVSVGESVLDVFDGSLPL